MKTLLEFLVKGKIENKKVIYKDINTRKKFLVTLYNFLCTKGFEPIDDFPFKEDHEPGKIKLNDEYRYIELSYPKKLRIMVSSYMDRATIKNKLKIHFCFYSNNYPGAPSSYWDMNINPDKFSGYIDINNAPENDVINCYNMLSNFLIDNDKVLDLANNVKKNSYHNGQSIYDFL